MLLDVEVATEPLEVVPVAHLPGHVGPVRLTRLDPDRSAVIVRQQRVDLADRSIVKPSNRFAVAGVVSQAKSRNDRELLLLRFFRDREHLTHAGSIDGHRFLGEHVLARGDRRFEVHRPEMWRRRQEHDIHAAVDRSLIGIESHELAIGRDIDLIGHVW